MCLSVCVQNISQSYEGIFTKFFGAVRRGSRNNPLDFGGDPNPLPSPILTQFFTHVRNAFSTG